MEHGAMNEAFIQVRADLQDKLMDTIGEDLGDLGEERVHGLHWAATNLAGLLDAEIERREGMVTDTAGEG